MLYIVDILCCSCVHSPTGIGTQLVLGMMVLYQCVSCGLLLLNTCLILLTSRPLNSKLIYGVLYQRRNLYGVIKHRAEVG